jgi:hypothetical protein
MNAMWRELCAASSASEDVVIYGWVAITTYGYDVFGARLHGRYYIDTHVPKLYSVATTTVGSISNARWSTFPIAAAKMVPVNDGHFSQHPFRHRT